MPLIYGDFEEQVIELGELLGLEIVRRKSSRREGVSRAERQARGAKSTSRAAFPASLGIGS